MARFNWFRRNPPAPERKMPFPMPMMALHQGGVASWSPGDTASLAQEGFLRNPVVHRCVSVIAQATASMPWILYGEEGEIEKHPALTLLRKPSPGQSGRGLLERMASHMLVWGNAYLQVLSLGEEPRELHLLRPERVRRIHDRAGRSIGLAFEEIDRRQVFRDDEEPAPVLHLKALNPLDDLGGLSPLHAAHMALDIHNAASRWNKALLDNSARPSGALVYNVPDAGNLTPEQFDRLKSELEEGYAGAQRAGRPMLLEGGLDWKAMAFSPRDMDFMEAKNGAARDIALAFGVPPMLLGIPGDLTHANYLEANRALWRNTVLPLAGRISDSIGTWLASHYDTDFRLDFDRDGVEALAGDREQLWRRLNDAGFLDEDEKRAAAGYGPRH